MGAAEREGGVFRSGLKGIHNLLVIEGELATKNLTPGKTVYGERIVSVSGVEYRVWNPRRSKLAAAIYNGLDQLPLRDDERVLYLGTASGTTASHFSDLVPRGLVYCVEFSQRVFRELMSLCEVRRNMIPILADASKPMSYVSIVEECGFLYQDVAQPNQAEILLSNADVHLKRGGFVAMAVKARSIDVTEKPERIYQREAALLRKGGIDVFHVIDLTPYEKDHAMITGMKP